MRSVYFITIIAHRCATRLKVFRLGRSPPSLSRSLAGVLPLAIMVSHLFMAFRAISLLLMVRHKRLTAILAPREFDHRRGWLAGLLFGLVFLVGHSIPFLCINRY